MLSHPALDRLRQSLQGSPWEGRLWLVGGCVRDALLGRPLKADFDLVLEGDALDVVEWLWDRRLVDHPPVTYPRFGTAMAHLLGSSLEFVTARSESYVPESRKPEVSVAALLDDARRRDFTCNALMENLHSGQPLDLLGKGMSDLRARILRTPYAPAETFRDDPLRMLRAVRFAAQLGFSYAPGLAEAIQTEAPRLKIISAERIQQEFAKMLVLARASSALADLVRLGLADYVAPELGAMVGVEQGQYHHLDVWDHTLLVIENARTDDLVLALACLLHDVGKPATRTIDAEGHTRFFGHETLGEEMSRAILRRLKFSKEVVDRVALLVRNHMRLGTMPRLTAPAARRLLRDLGDALPQLLDLVDADVRGLKPGVQSMDIPALRAQLDQIRAQTPPEVLRSPLTGDEIMRTLGLSPGPEVGRAQRWLTEKVLEGELSPEDSGRAEQLLREEFR